MQEGLKDYISVWKYHLFLLKAFARLGGIILEVVHCHTSAKVYRLGPDRTFGHEVDRFKH